MGDLNNIQDEIFAEMSGDLMFLFLIRNREIETLFLILRIQSRQEVLNTLVRYLWPYHSQSKIRKYFRFKRKTRKALYLCGMAH